MKIKVIATGKTEETPDLYAARLIEQGKAVPAHAPAARDKAETKKSKGK